MMRCLRADVRIVNSKLCINVGSVGGLSVDYSVIKKTRARIRLVVKPVSSFDANIDFAYAKLLAGVSSCNVPIIVKIDNFCGQILPTPYLEIEPEILWVYPDFEVENFVYSNTDWYIN